MFVFLFLIAWVFEWLCGCFCSSLCLCSDLVCVRSLLRVSRGSSLCCSSSICRGLCRINISVSSFSCVGVLDWVGVLVLVGDCVGVAV